MRHGYRSSRYASIPRLFWVSCTGMQALEPAAGENREAARGFRSANVNYYSDRRAASTSSVIAGERSADEASLLVPGGPRLLAGCLVQFGRRVRGESRYAWLAVKGSGFRSGLGRRVHRLLQMGGTARPAPPRSAPSRRRRCATRRAATGRGTHGCEKNGRGSRRGTRTCASGPSTRSRRPSGSETAR